MSEVLFSDEVGKEKKNINGKNNEKSKISREESGGDEELGDEQRGSKCIPWQGFIFQKKWEDEEDILALWLLHM